MPKIVFIGAGSGFGANSFVDLMSFEELRGSHVVLVDVNPGHLEPVAAYCRKVVQHYDAPAVVTTAASWRDGVLEGADYVITSFAQGGPAYTGVPYAHEMNIPREFGIHQNVGDTAGIGGVFRAMRTAPELIAIGKDMEARCPGAWLINYVNPMSMLTRTLCLACPKINVLGLCHNVQYGIRRLAPMINRSHKDFRYSVAGINHMAWFLRLEYLDGRSAYPDLLAAGEKEECYRLFPVQFELLKHFGYWTTESSGHMAEYLPYFMSRKEDREAVRLGIRQVAEQSQSIGKRWTADSDLVQQLDGRKPLRLTRSFEYDAHIIHAMQTDNVYRMNLNVLNRGMIENLPDGYCVEVPCTVDRTGVAPHCVGSLPIALGALCRGMADMQTLASDAILEKDLGKACLACMIDPCTAASAPPSRIKECFNKVLAADRAWLEPYWTV